MKKTFIIVAIGLTLAGSAWGQKADSLFLSSLRHKYNDAHEQAFQDLQAALAEDSTMAAAWFEISHYQLWLNKKEQAWNALQKAVRYAPDNAVYRKNYAELCLESGQNEEAITTFKWLLQSDPQNPEWHAYLSSLYMHQKQFDKAKPHLQYLTEVVPDDMTNWASLLTIAVNEQDTANIIALSEQAQQLFPDVPDFYYYAGMTYFMQEDYQAAMQTFQTAMNNLQDQQENAHYLSIFATQIADLYYLMGKKKKAYNAYETALQYNENNVAALNNYAYFLSLDKSDLEKAEKMATLATQIEPDNATYLDTYAWVFFQRGKIALAKTYIERALEKATRTNGEMLEHYGDILYKAGEIDAAVEQWERAKIVYLSENESVKLIEKKIARRKYYSHK